MTTDAPFIAAGEFKAKCLALLDEVADTGHEFVITKRGRPVARLVPVSDSGPPSLLGSVLSEGDIISPIEDSWESEQ